MVKLPLDKLVSCIIYDVYNVINHLYVIQERFNVVFYRYCQFIILKIARSKIIIEEIML